MISPIKNNNVRSPTILEQFEQNKFYAESSWKIYTRHNVQYLWNGKYDKQKELYLYDKKSIPENLIKETEDCSKPIYIKHSSYTGVISNNEVSVLMLQTNPISNKALVRYEFVSFKKYT